MGTLHNEAPDKEVLGIYGCKVFTKHIYPWLYYLIGPWCMVGEEACKKWEGWSAQLLM